MSVRTIVNTALGLVLANTWLKELPEQPTFPAAVFDVETTPEEAWCAGGGYDQHSVHLIAMSRDADQLDALMPQFRAAFEALLPYFMYVDESGDADYEPDPRVFARFLIVRLRMRQA